MSVLCTALPLLVTPCLLLFITAGPNTKLCASGVGPVVTPVSTLTQGGALFSLVPLVWESNPKLQGVWCKPNHQPSGDLPCQPRASRRVAGPSSHTDTIAYKLLVPDNPSSTTPPPAAPTQLPSCLKTSTLPPSLKAPILITLPLKGMIPARRT